MTDISLVPNITSPCLVVVDMQVAFTDRSSPLCCDAEVAVAETARLVDAARSHRVPVVYLRIAYDEGSRAAAGAFGEKVPALPEMAEGTRMVEIDDRVAPLPGEPVITKLFASGFFGTPLAQLLASHGCDGLVCTGTSTSGCVRATVVDAIQHGFRPIIPREAVADRAAGSHDAALTDIDAKYGYVVSAAEARELLAAGRLLSESAQ